MSLSQQKTRCVHMVFAFAILSVNSPLTFAASPLFTVDTPGLRANESSISDGNMVVGMPLSVPLISQIKKNGANPQYVKNGPEKTLLIIPPVGVLPSMMESPLSDSGLPSNVVTAELRWDTDTVGEPVSVKPPCTPKGRSYSLISPSLIQGTLLEPMTVVDTQNAVHNRPKSHITHGPFVGHIDEISARIWARVDRSGCYRLIVSSQEGSTAKSCIFI